MRELDTGFMKRKKLVKAELLSACETTLKEYEENRHQTNPASCPLCLLYYNGSKKEPCEVCPMNVFGDGLGCLHRQCRPINCKPEGNVFSETYPISLQRVTEFYQEVCNELRTLKAFNRTIIRANLARIDKEVAVRFNKFYKFQ